MTKQLMTPEHSGWAEFALRLVGYESPGSSIVNPLVCSGGRDKPRANAILATMPEIDIDRTMKYFEEHGGYCDCEILMNVPI